MLKELKKESNLTRTQNGALTNDSSLDYVLDYFAQGSALRNRSEKEIMSLFNKSYSSDRLLTLKILFYSRDIRGGQGERDTFRTIIHNLAIKNPNVAKKNIELIPEYGRWDDIYALVGTPLENMAFGIIRHQLIKDMESETPSLLAKWLKSENTSSKESKALGTLTRKKLKLKSSQYRKMLSHLRKKIGIVETKITNKEYSNIDYSKLPSQAGMKYRNAFWNNDEDRYYKFLDSLSKGEVKVNTKTLYPYEIIRNVINCGGYNEQEISLLNSLWTNLPDYIKDDKANAIVVADTSGSMHGTPIQIALSLALYFAERNKGPFANHFITFSKKPRLQEIIGENLYEKVSNMYNADWDMNTNIKAVFELILNTAQKYNISQEDIPSRVIIVSDMEFDSCTGKTNRTLFETIGEEFKEAGYKLPQLVFWNVNSMQDNIPMTILDTGVQLVSGASPNTFEALLRGEFLSAYDLMLSIINAERYNAIKI